MIADALEEMRSALKVLLLLEETGALDRVNLIAATELIGERIDEVEVLVAAAQLTGAPEPAMICMPVMTLADVVREANVNVAGRRAHLQAIDGGRP